MSDKIRWEADGMTDFDMKWWRDQLKEADAVKAGEQYARFYATKEKLKLLNRIRGQVEMWQKFDRDDEHADLYADFLAWIDDVASQVGGYQVEAES